MLKTDGLITAEQEGFKVENTLFTYSEEEMEQNRINKNNADLILNPQFIPVYPQMIRDGYSYLESIIFGFINFFLNTNDRFYCSNEQLGEMLGLSDKTISLAVKKLKDTGLIDISYKIKSNGGKIRFIRRGNLKNVNSDFTKMYSPTLQKCKGIENKIIENNIITKSKDLEGDYSELFNNYYGKNKGIDVKVCTKLINAKLNEGYTIQDITNALVLYNCECRTKGADAYRYVKKFETWIKEFQPITDEDITRVVIQHRERMDTDSKYITGVGKIVIENLNETFGKDKIKEIWKATNNKGINLRFT